MRFIVEFWRANQIMELGMTEYPTHVVIIPVFNRWNANEKHLHWSFSKAPFPRVWSVLR